MRAAAFSLVVAAGLFGALGLTTSPEADVLAPSTFELPENIDRFTFDFAQPSAVRRLQHRFNRIWCNAPGRHLLPGPVIVPGGTPYFEYGCHVIAANFTDYRFDI